MTAIRPNPEKERSTLLKKANEMLSDDLRQAVELAYKIAKKPAPEIKEKQVSTGTQL